MESTGWNQYFNKPLIETKPFTFDADSTTFSTFERQSIQQIWAQVAEDYASFDVDVTTEQVPQDRISRSDANDTVFGTRVVVSGGQGSEVGDTAFGGRAYRSAFSSQLNHDFFQPARVYGGALGSTKTIAEAISHGVGHNGGLSHDGTTTTIGESRSCRASVAAQKWFGDYGMSVCVTNTGSGELNDWAVTLTLPSGQSFDSVSSNVSISESTSVIVANQSWMQRIEPGSSRGIAYTNALMNGNESTTPEMSFSVVEPPPSTTIVPTTIVPTTIAETTSTTIVTTTTIVARETCDVAVEVLPYYGGYGVHFKVVNTGTTVLKAWTIDAQLPDGQSFTLLAPNARPLGSGATVQATESWMSNIGVSETRSVAWLHVSTNSNPDGRLTATCHA